MKGKLVEVTGLVDLRITAVKEIVVPEANLIISHVYGGLNQYAAWFGEESNPNAKLLGEVDVPDALIEAARIFAVANEEWKNASKEWGKSEKEVKKLFP